MKIIESETISIEGGQLFTIKKMDLKRGSLIAIYGESGTGKTTLLNHLQSKLKDQFKVTTYGQLEITEVKQENLNSNDESYLLAEEIATLKQTLGISELLKRDIETLSGGQRQRVILFNKLLVNSDLYLLDEPTSFLDTKTAQKCIKNIKAIAKAHNKCIVIVTHSHDIYDYVDNFYEIENGTLKTVKIDVMQKNHHTIKQAKSMRISWVSFAIFTSISGILFLAMIGLTNSLEEPLPPKNFAVQSCYEPYTSINCDDYYGEDNEYEDAYQQIVEDNSSALKQYRTYWQNLLTIPWAINECYENGWYFDWMELPTMENLYTYEGWYYYTYEPPYMEKTVPYLEYYNQEMEKIYTEIDTIVNTEMNAFYQETLGDYNEAIKQRNMVLLIAFVIFVVGIIASIRPVKKVSPNSDVKKVNPIELQKFLSEIVKEHNLRTGDNIEITYKKEQDKYYVTISNWANQNLSSKDIEDKISKYFSNNNLDLEICIDTQKLLSEPK